MAEYECTWKREELIRRIREFGGRVRAEGFRDIVTQTCEKAEGLDDDHAGQIIASCVRLATSDDNYGDHERAVIQKIESNLKELPFIRRALLAPVKSDHSSQKASKAQRIFEKFAFAVITVAALSLTYLLVQASGMAALDLIALVGWIAMHFSLHKFIDRRKIRLFEEHKQSLQVLLNAPRDGLAIADGQIYQAADSELIKCIWSDRECVFYAFCLDEVYHRNTEEGQVEIAVEVYRDTKGIPFEIRDEYGTAKVGSDLKPVPSDFQTDWDHYKSPGRYKEVYWSLYERCPKTRLTKKGYLRQRYVDLLPGQHVSMLGEMAVETNSEGQSHGCFAGNVEYSTKPKPDFDSLKTTPSSNSVTVAALRDLMLLVVPVVYIFWAALRE